MFIDSCLLEPRVSVLQWVLFRISSFLLKSKQTRRSQCKTRDALNVKKQIKPAKMNFFLKKEKKFSILSMHNLFVINLSNNTLPLMYDVISPPLRTSGGRPKKEEKHNKGRDHAWLPLLSSHSLLFDIMTSRCIPSALVQEETLNFSAL